MIKHWIKKAALLVLVVMNSPCMAADLSGDWIAQIATQGEPQYSRVSLQVNETAVSGTWGDSKIDGSLTGGKLAIKLISASGAPAGALDATITGDTIIGTGTVRAAAGG